METKIGNFFEEHVEKMVLLVVVLVCMWLLVTRVILSPNEVEYNGQKFGTGEIDNYISKQAEILEDKLNRKPELKQASPGWADYSVRYSGQYLSNGLGSTTQPSISSRVAIIRLVSAR